MTSFTKLRHLAQHLGAPEQSEGTVGGHPAGCEVVDRHRSGNDDQIEISIDEQVGVRWRVCAAVDVAKAVDGHRLKEARYCRTCFDRRTNIDVGAVEPKDHPFAVVQTNRRDQEFFLGPLVAVKLDHSVTDRVGANVAIWNETRKQPGGTHEWATHSLAGRHLERCREKPNGFIRFASAQHPEAFHRTWVGGEGHDLVERFPNRRSTA